MAGYLVRIAIVAFAALAAAVLPLNAYDLDAAAKSFAAADLARPMKVLRGWEGMDSQISERRFERIVDPESWQALWQTHAPHVAAPAVDFMNEMVIAIFAGKVDSQTWRLPLYSVVEGDGAIEITTTTMIYDVLTSGPTTPYVIAVLPFATKPVLILSRTYALMRSPQTRYELTREFPYLTSDDYVQSGNSWMAKGDVDRALADYAFALRLNPRDTEAFNRRGMAWLERGNLERAIAEFDQAIQLAGQAFIDHHPHNNRCWAKAASGRNLESALADCDRALELSPGNADTLDSRGFVYLRMGRLDNALADYDAALARNPKLAPALYARGLTRLKKGDDQAGQADIDAAKALQKDVDEMFARFGVTP